MCRRGTRWTSFLLVALAATLARADSPTANPSPETIDFQRHIAPLLGKLGCNAASCHGSSDGKGSFRLSLFGHDLVADYRAICRDENARRVNPTSAADSLLLLKGGGRVAHAGGRRLKPGTWQYQLVEQWIQSGAPFSSSAAHVESLTIRPPEVWLKTPDATESLVVVARFSDSSELDVTRFCDFRIRDDYVAEASEGGQIIARHPGDTTVVATYGPWPATSRILVPRVVSESLTWPELSAGNFIDVEVFEKLRRLGITPSPLSSDTEFLRRVHLATIGSLPTPDEIRVFVADSRPDKRTREVERLLASPAHAILWATRYCELTGNQIDVLDDDLGKLRAAMWHDWLRRRFADNRPYDEIVRGILCATSRSEESVERWIHDEAESSAAARNGQDSGYENKSGLDLYWRRGTPNGDYPLDEITERTASVFLGVRLECARCHKHPFDRWTQDDYRAFANVFARVRFGMSPELRAGMTDLLEQRRNTALPSRSKPLPRMTEVYLTDKPLADASWAAGAQPVPRALGGPDLDASHDPRHSLMEWLLQPNNSHFAPNVVNRVWMHYFGRGLVEPVDGFSQWNPPTHPELLDTLSADFASHGFDLRRLERLILTSTSWQLSSAPNPTNVADQRNYSRSYVRLLPAEVVWDMLGDALGTPFSLGEDFPPGRRAIEIAPSRVRDERLNRFFHVFNRPERVRTCDCERVAEPTVRQSLFLMSDSKLQSELDKGRITTLLAHETSNDQILDELFLATLSRWPTCGERETAMAALEQQPDRRQSWTEILWALINTREFITNH